jgi:hypothetical protein
MNKLIVLTFDAVAFSAAMALVYVGMQAAKDLHLNRTDRPWVRKYRKASFIADAAYIFLTVCFQNYWLVNPTTVSVGIVVILQMVFGGAILVASFVSMKERAPPQSGHRIHHASFGRPSFVERLIGYFTLH